MNLLDVLQREHRTLLDLLRRAGRTSVRARTARSDLLAKARAAFELLAELEETQLLPALRAHATDNQASIEWRLAGSAEELAHGRRLFDELRDTDPGDRRWIVRLILLEEHVEQHVAAEQRELYPLAKRIGQPRVTLEKAAAPEADARIPVTNRTMRQRVASLWV